MHYSCALSLATVCTVFVIGEMGRFFLIQIMDIFAEEILGVIVCVHVVFKVTYKPNGLGHIVICNV